MHRLRAGLLLFGIALFPRPSVSSGVPVAVRVDCDSLVATRASDPLRYRQRGDRCEGVYGKSVSGSSTLRVVSLVESLEAFDDSSSLPLRVEWTSPPGDSVTVRASAVRAGLYYRMETAHPIAGSRFVWPSDVRTALRISSTDVGVVGAIAKSIGGARREVLVPLRISQREAPVHSAHYRLTLWPTVGLSEAYLTVAATDTNGRPTRYLQRDEALGYGYYPAGRPVVVRLPALGRRGMYLVRVAATREGGGSATTSVLVYHAGAAAPREP